MARVVTFGEIMMRLATPGFLRFVQARQYDVTFAGGEANVAAALAQFGVPADFVTRLPGNDLGQACLNFLRQYGIGVSHIVRGGDRLGIYFLETGAAQRASKVIYDRAHSSFATIAPGMIEWKTVFADAGWFHFTGITPAVSASAAQVCIEAAQCAKASGLTVSCDLNYRAKLWKWGKRAGEVMPELLRLCDIAICNEEDAEKVLGIRAPQADIAGANVSAQAYVPVCQELIRQFPNLRAAAITLRGSISASHNTWAGILYENGSAYCSPVYDVAPIVDRVGSGDSFAGALIYALGHYETRQQTIDFAVAASCLKHSVPGDFNVVAIEEVEQLMRGDASGRVQR